MASLEHQIVQTEYDRVASSITTRGVPYLSTLTPRNVRYNPATHTAAAQIEITNTINPIHIKLSAQEHGLFFFRTYSSIASIQSTMGGVSYSQSLQLPAKELFTLLKRWYDESK